MSTHNNGGPAFPVVLEPNAQGKAFGEVTQQFAGMTLRDYFAANAMQGFLSAFASEWSHGEIARAAYIQADTMLAERAK